MALTKEYVVVVRFKPNKDSIRFKTKAFSFKTKDDMLGFIKDAKEKFINFEYLTTTILV